MTPSPAPPLHTRKTYKKQAKFTMNIQTELHEPKISKVNKQNTKKTEILYGLQKPKKF